MDDKIIFEAIRIKREDLQIKVSPTENHSNLSERYQKSIRSSDSSSESSESLISLSNDSVDIREEFRLKNAEINDRLDGELKMTSKLEEVKERLNRSFEEKDWRAMMVENDEDELPEDLGL